MKRYIAEFVYGATDGAVTTFAVIAGTVGANLDPVIVLLLGISNLLADGFSMAASNYLSQRSNNELPENEGKIHKPFRGALMTFVAFVVVGSIPLIPFVIGRFIPAFAVHQFSVAIVATSMAFLVIGGVRGRVTKRNSVLVSFETLGIGAAAGAVAYGVGAFIQSIV